MTQSDTARSASSIDPAEIAKFEAMAAAWWDPDGQFRPLHRMNPIRLDYIARQIEAEFDRDRTGPAPFAGLDLIDIGCGGGLLCEPMARLGANVTGIDAASSSIPVARLHAERAGLRIAYRQAAAEAVVAEGTRYDVVLAMEVIEHVVDPAGFLAACAALLKPGGVVVCSTLNRTARAYVLAIVGAERVMGWLPRGTHDWSKFIAPDELHRMLEAAALVPVDRKGMVFDPIARDWALSTTDLNVNYVTTAIRPA